MLAKQWVEADASPLASESFPDGMQILYGADAQAAFRALKARMKADEEKREDKDDIKELKWVLFCNSIGINNRIE